MRGMLAALLVVWGVTVLGDQPRDDPVKKDLDRLQGKWLLIGVEYNGTKFGGNDDSDEASPIVLLVRGNKFLLADGQDEWGSIVIDPTTTPKLLDFALARTKRVVEGIYALEGNTLTICQNYSEDPVKERPTTFSTKDKRKWAIHTFRRPKTDKVKP
jgi:uncharacterized protein (TIGR03067 family)